MDWKLLLFVMILNLLMILLLNWIYFFDWMRFLGWILKMLSPDKVSQEIEREKKYVAVSNSLAINANGNVFFTVFRALIWLAT